MKLYHGDEEIVQKFDYDHRCGCCHCGHAHTYAAHRQAIRAHDDAHRQKLPGYWLCLCARVHPPEIDCCPGCLTRRTEGIQITLAVKAGLS